MSERVKRQGRAGRCEYCEAGVQPTQSAFERWLDAELAKLQAAGWSFHEPIDPEIARGVDVLLKIRVKRSRPANRQKGHGNGQGH